MKINIFGRKKYLLGTAKRQLLKALNCRDIAGIRSLIVEWQSILGAEKLTNLIVNEVMVECDSHSHSWFCQIFLGQAQYEQMEEKAQSNIFQILLGEGLEPGKDFSSGLDGMIIVGDRAQQILLSQVPQEHRASFEAQLESLLVLDPVTTIEQQLGCAFFTNLTEIAIQQMQVLSNSQAAAYLGVLLAGLVSRHPQLKDADFPTRFIFNTLQELSPERAILILNDPETNPQFDEIMIFQHLLAAMGDKEYHRIAEEEDGISLDQLKKLDLVWCGERRLSEIVAMMEKWHFRNR
ncbi:hypothetical protein [Nostoc sp. WHI]|uniref:hypothetical protein n=1 Tax=Nostoc sp. WHI TaxID=2650611 RepID=UPI0018C4D5AE|nr:hypothetical protein [Nostoc sp. WHI]MBG1268515.1 hypothetical protein [Nostoc sp. WHI]